MMTINKQQLASFTEGVHGGGAVSGKPVAGAGIPFAVATDEGSQWVGSACTRRSSSHVPVERVH
jgi:hypothetical protein